MRTHHLATGTCVLAIALLAACTAGGKGAPTHDSIPAQAVGTVARQPCDSATTQLAMTTCWSNAATEAEARESAELAKTLALVKQKGTAAQANALAAAEEKWKAYRDAQCEADASFFAGGSVAPATAAICRTQLANERRSTLELIDRDWSAR
jgi:uncharacterized protein YecT (DUF1311 family)